MLVSWYTLGKKGCFIKVFNLMMTEMLITGCKRTLWNEERSDSDSSGSSELEEPKPAKELERK